MPTYPAWWDFYIPSTSGRSGVTEAVTRLETGLNLGMQVRSIAPSPSKTNDYHVEAWTYIETPSVEGAAVALLARVGRVVRTIGQPFLFDPARDDGVISFYWDAPDERGSAISRSSGVMLMPCSDGEYEDDDAPLTPEEREHRHLVRKAPRFTAPEDPVCDWTMEIDVRLHSESKLQAKDKRWPLVQAQLPGAWEVRDVRGGATRALPYSIKAHGKVRSQAGELIGQFLRFGGGNSLSVKLGADSAIDTIQSSRAEVHAQRQGIASYMLTRFPAG